MRERVAYGRGAPAGTPDRRNNFGAWSTRSALAPRSVLFDADMLAVIATEPSARSHQLTGGTTMLRASLCCAVAAGALLAASAGARAAEPYTFALVPKSTNNPFYDQALAGCKKAEAELKGAIKCLYIGLVEHGGGDEEAQIVADLITT